jgi:MoxR-like ATPase
VRGARLIRLQCYEGLDVHAAMYEWNYQRQLLAIKLLEHDERPTSVKEQDIFSERYLLKRPLLEAISCAEPPVLLIDEVDRADEAFEAYLLELLSDFQMSIPELGTIRAVTKPLVVITSNGTRELSDALRRRCLYQYIDYPAFAKELAIVEIRAPQAPDSWRARWSISCKACAAWICKKSRASQRPSTGPRRCCAWEFP